jgi:hypothetical protein
LQELFGLAVLEIAMSFSLNCENTTLFLMLHDQNGFSLSFRHIYTHK